MLPVGLEPNILRMKAGRPGAWMTGAALRERGNSREEKVDSRESSLLSTSYSPPSSEAHTHGWIRTTTDAINSRTLYQLSYMGIVDDALSRMDLNHHLRDQSPASCRLDDNPKSLRASPPREARRRIFGEKDSNPQPTGSEPVVLPIELSLIRRRLDSNQHPTAYEAVALPLSYAPVILR